MDWLKLSRKPWKEIPNDLKRVADRLTGRSTEEQLTQYSEVYGEVLLGMHDDIEKFSDLIKAHEKTMETGIRRVVGIQEEASRTLLRLDDLLATMQAYEESARGCSEQSSSSAALARAAAADLQQAIQENSSAWAHAMAIHNSLTTAMELQSRQHGALDVVFRRFRTQTIWAVGLLSLVLLVEVIAWTLHLKG